MLECDDHKTNEYIHHEEGYDNDEYYVENSYPFPIVIYWTKSWLVWIYWYV